jgi:hypothetical protein
MGSHVIQLDQLSAVDGFPAYVAIYSEQFSANPFALSPTVMRWSEQILICRVNHCQQFWLAQQQKCACTLEQLFERVLEHHHGNDYIAVFASHPWQALVYLAYQVQQQSQGAYFLQSRLNRNIFKSLGWEYWFAPQQQLSIHLQATGAKRFNPDTFQARQSQLRRFINRIGLDGPFTLQQADHHAITRRFEGWLGKVWRWTFDNSAELHSFPWLALEQPARPTVSRDLEYPVNQWPYIEPLLREDLERLCEQFNRDDSEHINSMLWQITLFNDQVIDVELSFRHPYSLHREIPNFKTALYQAWYVYADLIGKLQQRDKDLDLPESMPFIGWRVEVCERIHLPPLLWDLFAGEGGDINHQNLFDLQNKLSIPIESYRSRANFYPEQSFQSTPIGGVAETSYDEYQWSASSDLRPLFYYQAADEIEAPPPGQRFFLERCSNQWWLHGDPQNQIKDYFVLKDRRGRASWVYRDFDGRWFRQGEYF